MRVSPPLTPGRRPVSTWPDVQTGRPLLSWAPSQTRRRRAPVPSPDCGRLKVDDPQTSLPSPRRRLSRPAVDPCLPQPSPRHETSIDATVLNADTIAVTYAFLERAGGVAGTIKGLGQFKNLTDVYLGETRATDEDVKNLACLPGLKKLELDGTRVTDAGIRRLLGLPALRGISLSGTRLTDAGLLDLATIKSLQSVTVWRMPGVTYEGLVKLRRLRPDIEIQR